MSDTGSVGSASSLSNCFCSTIYAFSLHNNLFSPLYLKTCSVTYGQKYPLSLTFTELSSKCEGEFTKFNSFASEVGSLSNRTQIPPVVVKQEVVIVQSENRLHISGGPFDSERGVQFFQIHVNILAAKFLEINNLASQEKLSP